MPNHQLTGNLDVNAPIGVILPTYSEAQNIEGLITDIEKLPLNTSILVIDDSSPDNTAEIVRNLQKKHDNILLCVRSQKSGLGTAITDGFKTYLSLKHPPRVIVTMDADYSHDPKAIPQLLQHMQPGVGVVVGSRYCRGGNTVGCSTTRRIISRTANIAANSIVGLKVRDCTSGFRCYSTEFLKDAVSSLHSQTYEIQVETLRQAVSRGFKVVEVPILFVNRKRGKSKLKSGEIRGYASYILKSTKKS